MKAVGRTLWPSQFTALWFHGDNQLEALSDTEPETGLNFVLCDRLLEHLEIKLTNKLIELNKVPCCSSIAATARVAQDKAEEL